MSDFEAMSGAERKETYNQLKEQYDTFKEQKLKLDMSRGKPCVEQLDLSMGLLTVLNAGDSMKAQDGTDIRNYGGIDGIPEAKQFAAELFGVSTKEVLIGGNSSLNMMHDTIARALLHGVYGGEGPWSKQPVVKFICPSPGYDRHFAICELFGIEMIAVNMTAGGPDMDAVEKLAAEDDSIRGIWCVPKYSNPDGITYSDEVVDRLANMRTAASDFRIFWDDAYTVHHLTDQPDQLKNILDACKEAGNPDRVFLYGSTYKISFPGAVIAMMAASENNLGLIRKQLMGQTIGPDKINQLRHVRFFRDMDVLKAHMEQHAAIINPKFELVLGLLESELGSGGLASWNKPNGGYFISLNTRDGCAKEVVRLAAEAGVTMTTAGATFPYGNDPRDRNIRIAPTLPTLADLKTAIEILCLCVKLVSIQQLQTVEVDTST
ncbi:MAG: transcriptional regulator [Paenibacillus sp.]|nr:transcriptional regulator [Paenibacillus sp.]